MMNGMPSEAMPQQSGVPSGYESSSTIRDIAIDSSVLPWLKEPYDLTVSEVALQSGSRFLLASAIKSHDRLTAAANGMTEGQRKNADNMFYSRVPSVVEQGYSSNVETMPSPSTEFPIYVMRNKGGQRVYFARISLGLSEENMTGPTVLRLGVCDKNKQGDVMAVPSSLDRRANRRKLSK